MTESDWLARVAASAVAVDHAVSAMAFIDAATGTVLHTNRALCELLGEDLPPSIDDLVERGSIARPALDEGRRQVLASGGRCVSWATECRYHRPDRTTVELALSLSVIPRFGAPGSVLQVVASEKGANPVQVQYGVSPAAPSTVVEVYDQDISIRRSDPRLADYGYDPRARIGIVTLVVVHPEDQVAAWTELERVWSGAAISAEYAIRVVDARGGWARIASHALRMVGDGDDLLVAVIRPTSQMKQDIPTGVLTDRELQVVDALFNGWRVPALATRDGVAPKTIRNQLSAIYRKLGVDGQAELLVRYLAPISGKSQRTDSVLNPNWVDVDEG